MRKQIDYSSFYKRPEWQRKRLEAFEASGFICDRCKSKERTLHLHHNYYVWGRKPWEYPAIAFSVLCDSCHASTHLSKTDWQVFEMVYVVAEQDGAFKARLCDLMEEAMERVFEESKPS